MERRLSILLIFCFTYKLYSNADTSFHLPMILKKAKTETEEQASLRQLFLLMFKRDPLMRNQTLESLNEVIRSDKRRILFRRKVENGSKNGKKNQKNLTNINDLNGSSRHIFIGK